MESVTEPRKVPAAHGWLWIKQGFALFRKNPILWIVLTGFTAIALILLASIPVVGDSLATILMPVLLAGFMLACRDLERGEELELAHLFAGFKTHTHQLVTLGGINLVGQLLILGAMMLVGGTKLAEIILNGVPDENPEALVQAMEGSGFAAILGLSLYAVLMMTMQFAPAQVLFKQTAPWDAMKNSLRTCLHNMLPLSVYGAVMLTLGIAACIPRMLGWLVLLPVMIATMYTAYCDLFMEPAPIAAAEEDEPPAF